tara:strand:+ start:4466 stop:4960 length:495 start_codon:yes stop_codon:yes gene_type:complete
MDGTRLGGIELMKEFSLYKALKNALPQVDLQPEKDEIEVIDEGFVPKYSSGGGDIMDTFKKAAKIYQTVKGKKEKSETPHFQTSQYPTPRSIQELVRGQSRTVAQRAPQLQLYNSPTIKTSIANLQNNASNVHVRELMGLLRPIQMRRATSPKTALTNVGITKV